jgi:cytochrome bd-type quinol oxidase subunit 2
MNDLIAKLKQPSLWTISVQLLILYVVSVAIFFGANAVHKKAEDALKDKVAKGDAGASAGLFAIAAALNFAGVLALIFVTRKTGENVRMAMVALPLFLIVEQHVRQMRHAPQERRAQLLGIAGVALGMGAAVAAFMPHAPLK